MIKVLLASLILLCFSFTSFGMGPSLLYAPWRTSYEQGANADILVPKNDCVFCSDNAHDEQYFIIKRFEHMMVRFNLYPYTSGHLLIVPLAHVAGLDQLSVPARSELMELTMHSVDILKKILHCDGVNVGINLGRAAGASKPDHLHVHVLPRFMADEAFIELIGNTRIISHDFKKLYQQFKPEFEQIFLK